AVQVHAHQVTAQPSAEKAEVAAWCVIAGLLAVFCPPGTAGTFLPGPQPNDPEPTLSKCCRLLLNRRHSSPLLASCPVAKTTAPFPAKLMDHWRRPGATVDRT